MKWQTEHLDKYVRGWIRKKGKTKELKKEYER